MKTLICVYILAGTLAISLHEVSFEREKIRGYVYELQTTTNLLDSTWVTLKRFKANGRIATWPVPDGDKRFYRYEIVKDKKKGHGHGGHK